MLGSRRNDGAHHLWVLLCEVVLGVVGIQTDAAWPIQALKDIQPPSHIPTKHFTMFLLLSC
jgi:hypothetical protein